MSPSLLSRVFLGALGVGVLLLVGGPVVAQDSDPRLEKVLADWKARRERLKTIHYWVEGERILPKGSSRDERGKPLNPESPPQDIVLPIKWSLLLDLPTQRHRFEVDERRYDQRTGKLYPEVWTNTFDGSVLKGLQPRQANTSPGHEPAPTTPDAGTYTGDLHGASFQPRHWPLFLGVGIIVLPGDPLYPGHLGPEELESEWFHIHGLGVHGGRSCLVVRGEKRRSGPYQEFWVDTGRDNAIVRFVQAADGSPQFDMDLQYQKAEYGWLLQGWTWNEYAEKTRVSCLERMRVKKVEVAPVLSNGDFDIEIRPGVLVRNTHMGEMAGAPKGVVEEKESRYYRAGENGALTEVVFVNGVEQKRWLWWPWCVAGLGLLAVVPLAWWLYVRRRKRPEGAASGAPGLPQQG